MPTAEYTKKAVKNYQSKFDLVQVRFPKGTKQKIMEQKGNKSINEYIVECVTNSLGIKNIETTKKETTSERGLSPLDSICERVLMEHVKKV